MGITQLRFFATRGQDSPYDSLDWRNLWHYIKQKCDKCLLKFTCISIVGLVSDKNYKCRAIITLDFVRLAEKYTVEDSLKFS